MESVRDSHGPAPGATPRPLARIVPISSHPSLSGDRAASLASDIAVRWSRVRSARERLATGFYDRRKVRGRIADVLLRELQHR